MIKKIFNWFYRRYYPIEYARSMGVTVGDGCRFIDVSFSTEPYLVTIGNNVSVTSTRFETHDGAVWVLRNASKNLSTIDAIKPIVVGDNVYIGYGCIILPGVTICDNVVIGAHSVITKDISSSGVYAGAPAKFIRTLEQYCEKNIDNFSHTKGLKYEAKRQFYEKKFKNTLGC